MKIIFIHDHKFKVDESGSFYTDGKFTNELFNRYINLEKDTIRVIARKINLDISPEKLNKVDHPQLIFNCVKGINPIQIFIINFYHNINILKDILNSDLNIMRLPSFLGLFTCFLCIVFGKDYFVEVVGHARDSLLDKHSNFFKKLFASIYSFFTRVAIKKATGAIYVTEYALQKDYPCLGITEYASNVILKIDSKGNPKKCYEVNKKINVGLIGSFNNHYKGIDLAIEAVAYLKNEKNIIANLYVLGHGSLLDEYQYLARDLQIENQVFFDGLLPLEEVSSWLDKLDIYIQPSLTEGLPRSLIEAMSRGLPCIGSNVGGIPELLSPQYLINTNNIEDLIDKLEALINSQSVREDAGIGNYHKAKEYDFEVLSERRDQFWKKASGLVEYVVK